MDAVDLGVNLFVALFAGAIYLLAVVLAWPAERPGLAAALLTGYLVGLLAAELLEARPAWGAGADRRGPSRGADRRQ